MNLDILDFTAKVQKKFPSTFSYYQGLGAAGVQGWNNFVTWAAQNAGSIWPSQGASWGRNFLDALAGIGGVALAIPTGGLSLALTAGAGLDVAVIRPSQQTATSLYTDVQAGAYQVGAKISGVIDTTINTGQKILTDAEAAGKTVIDTGQKLLTDAEKAGKTVADSISGLTGSAKSLMDSFANALKNLKLPSSLGNITMPSISLPNISLSLGGLSDQLSGATSGGTSMTTIAVIGGAVALGAFLLLR